MRVARRLRIHGRVQGVGFRAFVRQAAHDLGLEGWVRNRLDGTVEAVAVGEEGDVRAFVDRVRKGPRFGRVDRLDLSEEDAAAGAPSGFSILGDR
ncbi:MAG TPA: acylphosphatase [Candidatus Sulfomarinibacteraceae bacterium]|nr:acylphosphatase [Candidatus Sulfomarinibacteraceae bacterium]